VHFHRSLLVKPVAFSRLIAFLLQMKQKSNPFSLVMTLPIIQFVNALVIDYRIARERLHFLAFKWARSARRDSVVFECI